MSPGRETARRVLARVENEGAFAAAVLAAETAGIRDRREAALAFELVLGTLRRESWLNHLLAGVADRGLKKIDPEVMRILRVGAYQIAFLTRVPAAAAVNDAVSACKRTRAARLSGLVNALLRKIARLPEPSRKPPEEDDGADLETLALRHGLPEFVLKSFIATLGRDEALATAHAFNGPSRRTLRVNPHAISRAEVLERLGDGAEAGALSPWAVDVPSVHRAAPLVDEGVAAYQDEAAQLAVLALAPRTGESVLDACAGRGGKSAAIASLLKNGGRVVALDRAGSKLDRLEFELARQSLQAETVICDLAASPPPFSESFDRVLIDAPCSGSGTLGRRPEIRRRLTPESVASLTAVQENILANGSRALRPGGRLVYVVCSLLDAEGFGRLAPFLAGHPDFAPVTAPPPNWPESIPWNDGCIRISPSKSKTDGYQLLVLEKSAR